jgi:uncharacterized membrane protein HdeD (DUF308 family)
LIILGLIVICFPILGIIPLEVLTGVTVLFLGLGLISTGLTGMGDNPLKGFVESGLGVFAIILGIGFMFNPFLFSYAAAIFVFLSGILLILTGFIGLLINKKNDVSTSIIALVIGILYLVIAVFVANPFYLGLLIGLWLLLTGGLLLLKGDN